jgi:hypothetical protein
MECVAEEESEEYRMGRKDLSKPVVYVYLYSPNPRPAGNLSARSGVEWNAALEL